MVGHDVDEFGTNIKGDSAVVCNFLFPVIKRFCFLFFLGHDYYGRETRVREKYALFYVLCFYVFVSNAALISFRCTSFMVFCYIGWTPPSMAIF